MTTTDPLDTLLEQLSAMQHVARAMIARDYPADAEWDWDGDNYIWLAMEQTIDGGWDCGWLMRPGAYAYPVLTASGRTRIDAALALRKMMIEGK